MYRAGSKGNEPLEAIEFTPQNIEKHMGKKMDKTASVQAGDVCSLAGGDC